MFIDTFADPFDAFTALRAEVCRTSPEGFDPDAVVLATAAVDGRPSARVVLLRSVSRDGLLFYTNYTSRKGIELDANPLAAVCAHWPWLGQQVRVEGRVARASAPESDAYFASRPRGSQLGAWASRQSAPLASRALLEDEWRRVGERFEGGPVPRPDFWGGYRIVPDRFEFWEEGDSRLHDRLVFTPGLNAWNRRRLSP